MIRDGLDFSFSGLKTAVRRLLAVRPDARKEDVAASFVDACMDVLTAKAAAALDRLPSQCLVVVGGVAASPQLRERAQLLCDDRGVTLSLPPLKWSTDNAAMIALAAWDYVHSDAAVDLAPVSSLSIERF
jgi:N6-L-threonylcarbamoyladenine synthase